MYDPLTDIHHYSKTLSISQVVKFFEKKELSLTRAMIQNYIRDGLLPPPVNKRYYTHKHLAALVLIDYLKTVFDMADIKNAITPLMDDEGLSLDVYADILKKMEALSELWKAYMPSLLFNQETPKTFSQILLMTHAADLKALSLELAARIHPHNSPEM